MKAAGERTIADLRTDALRRMVEAVPTVVDGVESVARDDQAPARDRVRAFEAVMRAVFPQSGHDHVGAKAFSGSRPPSLGEELTALLRVPHADVEQKMREIFCADFGYTDDEASRLIDLWHIVALNPFRDGLTSDLVERFDGAMRDIHDAAAGVDRDDAGDVIELAPVPDVDEATEEISAPNTNGRQPEPAPEHPSIRRLVDVLTPHGLTIDDAADHIAAVLANVENTDAENAADDGDDGT